MDDVTRLRAAYERFVGGDFQPMLALLADAATYHLPGRHLGGGTLRGREAILGRMAAAARHCAAPPRVQLLTVSGAGAFVTSVERFSARRADASLDQDVCVVWRMEVERCTEIWSHFSDQSACDAFWDGFEV